HVLTWRRYTQYERHVEPRTLKVGDLHSMSSLRQLDLSIAIQRRMDAIIIDNQTVIDKELCTVIREQVEPVHAGYLNPEAAGVIDSEPFEPLTHARKTQVEPLRGHIERRRVDCALGLELTQIGQKLRVALDMKDFAAQTCRDYDRSAKSDRRFLL